MNDDESRIQGTLADLRIRVCPVPSSDEIDESYSRLFDKNIGILSEPEMTEEINRIIHG